MNTEGIRETTRGKESDEISNVFEKIKSQLGEARVLYLRRLENGRLVGYRTHQPFGSFVVTSKECESLLTEYIHEKIKIGKQMTSIVDLGIVIVD